MRTDGRWKRLLVAFLLVIQENLLRYAPLTRGTDNVRSLKLTAYKGRADREDILARRILGWSFCVRTSEAALRWRIGWDIEHLDENHQNNSIENLAPWQARGRAGHRQSSGRLGAVAKRRRF